MKQSEGLMKEPKTARGKETVLKILNAAEKLFSERGYHNTKITDIVQEAEVAPGTFYIYFPNKKNIFSYLMHELGHNLRHEIAENRKACTSRLELERIGFKTFFRFVEAHKGLFRIVWDAQFVDEEAFQDYYESFARKYIEGIKLAQKKGEMKKLDPESLTYALIGISNFIALKWIIFEKKPVPDSCIDAIMELIESGAFQAAE